MFECLIEMSEEITRTGIVTTCIVCGAKLAPRKYKFCSKRCLRTSYRRRHRDVVNGYARAYRKTHEKEETAVRYFSRIDLNEILCSNPERYAHHRELQRQRRHRAYERKHPGCRPYKPILSSRIPDWAVKGQEILDRRSVFLPGNMSDEKVIAANAIYEQQHAAENSKPKRVKTFFRGR